MAKPSRLKLTKFTNLPIYQFTKLTDWLNWPNLPIYQFTDLPNYRFISLFPNTRKWYNFGNLVPISQILCLPLPMEMRNKFSGNWKTSFHFQISPRDLTIGDTRRHLGILKTSFCLLSVCTSIAHEIKLWHGICIQELRSLFKLNIK